MMMGMVMRAVGVDGAVVVGEDMDGLVEEAAGIGNGVVADGNALFLRFYDYKPTSIGSYNRIAQAFRK